MHVLQPFTDLPYEQHCVQLRQVVVLVNDAVEQLPSLHTTARKEKTIVNMLYSHTVHLHAQRLSDLLFHDQNDVMPRLKGGVQLDEVGMVQLVHHLDLIPHHVLRDRQDLSTFCDE